MVRSGDFLAVGQRRTCGSRQGGLTGPHGCMLCPLLPRAGLGGADPTSPQSALTTGLYPGVCWPPRTFSPQARGLVSQGVPLLSSLSTLPVAGLQVPGQLSFRRGARLPAQRQLPAPAQPAAAPGQGPAASASPGEDGTPSPVPSLGGMLGNRPCAAACRTRNLTPLPNPWLQAGRQL